MNTTSRFTEESNGELRKIELEGTLFDRGVQYGSLCRDDISLLMEYLHGVIGESRALTDATARSYAKRCMPYIEEYSEQLAQEMRGIAEGSGRSYEDIVLIALLEEIENSSCTTFAATGQATVGGKTYLGQSWDNIIKGANYVAPLLIEVKQDSGPNFLTYTYPGILAGAGLNSKDIGISWNTVPFLDRKVGVPTYLIVAEVLRQERIGDAIDAILRADRAGCFNFVLANESEIYDVEATPSDVDITYHDTYMGHANHFVSEKFYQRQDMSKLKATTFIRHNRMNRILAEHCGSIDLEVCMDALQDHVNYPNSICRHGSGNSKQENFETEAGWVMVPADREMWLSYGPPCENTFKKYNI